MAQILMQYWKSKASLNRYKLRAKDFAFLLIPLVVGVVSYYVSDKVYSTVAERYVGELQLADISSFEVLKDASYKPPQVSIEARSLVSVLDLPEKPPTQNVEGIPPLNDINFADFQRQQSPDGSKDQGLKLELKLQGIYMSETNKFAIIDGKIYREDTTDGMFRVVRIEERRVLIELPNKEKRWLQLN